MNCACISVYRKQRLDESFSAILNQYQKYLAENADWFSIELDYHMKPTYTKFEKRKLTEIFGCFPEQRIEIFGDCELIFVAAHELIKHFGGLLRVNLGTTRDETNSYPGIKIDLQKKRYKYPLKHDTDYWLVDHIFIRKYFAKNCENNFEKFKLDPFLPKA